MKKYLILFGLIFTILTSFGQYVETDGSFSKTYERLRGWKSVDGEWVYDNGSSNEWTFVFNVEFYSSPNGNDMFGTVMKNSNGESQYFCNYIGQITEDKDEYGEYGEYEVDILSKDDETDKWEFWDTGKLRYYGNWTYMYMGYEPHDYYFSYFGLKQNENE